jgi:antitoxin component YwqK of YwqJK toxin-antitoxin module
LISGWKEYYGKGVANAEGLNKHAVYTYLAGKLIEVIVYRENSIAHKSTYVYDDRGNKIKELNSGPDAIFSSRSYKYDSAGNLIEEISTGTSYSTKVERIFDVMHNIVKESYFDNGSLAFVYNRTYEKGKLIKEEVSNSSGEVTRITLNSYNSQGKLAESTISSKSISSKTIIEYDEAGWMKKKETLTLAKDRGRFSSDDPSPGRVVIKYNVKGLEIERLNYSESGMLIRRQTSSFDVQERQTELVFYKANGEVESKRVYEYDEHGNRIKTTLVTVSPNGQVQYSTFEQRIISYY